MLINHLANKAIVIKFEQKDDKIDLEEFQATLKIWIGMGEVNSIIVIISGEELSQKLEKIKSVTQRVLNILKGYSASAGFSFQLIHEPELEMNDLEFMKELLLHAPPDSIKFDVDFPSTAFAFAAILAELPNLITNFDTKKLSAEEIAKFNMIRTTKVDKRSSSRRLPGSATPGSEVKDTPPPASATKTSTLPSVPEIQTTPEGQTQSTQSSATEGTTTPSTTAILQAILTQHTSNLAVIDSGAPGASAQSTQATPATEAKSAQPLPNMAALGQQASKSATTSGRAPGTVGQSSQPVPAAGVTPDTSPTGTPSVEAVNPGGCSSTTCCIL